MTRSSHSFAGAFRFTLFAISATLLVVPFIAHQVAAIWKPYEGFSEPPGLTVRSYDGMKERDYQCQNENGGIAGVSKYPRDRYFVDWTPLANSLGKQSIAWRINVKYDDTSTSKTTRVHTELLEPGRTTFEMGFGRYNKHIVEINGHQYPLPDSFTQFFISVGDPDNWSDTVRAVNPLVEDCVWPNVGQ